MRQHNGGEGPREIISLARKLGFELVRDRRRMIWRHTITGNLVTLPRHLPSTRGRTLDNVRSLLIRIAHKR